MQIFKGFKRDRAQETPRERRYAGVQGAVMSIVVAGCAALVVVPSLFLLAESLNTGDAQEFPPQQLGFGNYLAIVLDARIIGNTLRVAIVATVAAVVIGFLLAWVLTRTKIPGRAVLERFLEIPFYVTPLVGALAWSILASPESGFINQVWRAVGGNGALVNIYSPEGIAWVMAVFEGSVAFVMISAAMKAMDPALEEGSRVPLFLCLPRCSVHSRPHWYSACRRISSSSPRLSGK